MIDQKKYADQSVLLVADVVALIGGPISSRKDAAKLIENALHEAYWAGWNDKQQQLADAMYPRR